MRGHAAGRLGAVLVALLVLATACTPAGQPEVHVPPVTTAADEVLVGAFNFPESRLLAELYTQALAAAGYPMAPVLQLGSREIVEPALEQGRIDLVPEYTGSALGFLEQDAAIAGADVDATHARLVRAFAQRGVTVADAAPAQNQNAFAVTRETAAEHDLRTLTDLAGVAGELVLGGPPECPQRHTCLAGLQDVYGVQFARFLSLRQRAHVVAALEAGEIDVGLLFTTDPDVLINDFAVLADDRDLQPAENVVPVIRDAVIERHGPDLTAVLDRVSAGLTTAELGRLNLAAEQRPDEIEAVAQEWLERHGLTP
jgi:osmoprotectant transport system substrate-binding protein